MKPETKTIAMIQNLHFTRSLTRSLAIAALAIFMFLPGKGWGQTDDFTDGNFSLNPVWTGDLSSFAVSNAATLPSGTASTDGFFLASNSATGKISVCMPSTVVNEWKFSLGSPTFDPASSNFFGVILMSSVAVSGDIISTSWNGYYLKIGVNGTPDPIELWVKSGTSFSKVGDFPSSPSYSTGALTSGLNIRVTRNSSGVFELFYSPGFQFVTTPTVSAGTLTNNTFSTSNYFCVYSNFTSTGTTRRVYIDNIVLGTSLTSPTLSPDITSNDVDNNIDITFTDNSTWRAAITAVKIGGTALTVTTDYVLSAGNLQLIPSGGNPILQTAGSKAVTVEATGYSVASVTQDINAGAPTANSTVSIDLPLAPNASRTITCTAKDQYNNVISGYTFKYDATITNSDVTTAESYTIDGSPLTATTNDISVVATTNGSGVATFTAALPATIDANDGVSVQVQLSDGSTNIGSAFSYIQLLPQTITFGALSDVTYGVSDFIPGATSPTSALNPITYTSSNTSVATIVADQIHVIGAGNTNITASQAGDATYEQAEDVIQALLVNPIELTVTGAVASDKPYDGNTAASITGATLVGVINFDDVTVSGGGSFADANVGTGIVVTPSLSLIGADAGNYSLTQPTGLTADIIKADQTITFGSLSSKNFGDVPFGLTASANSGLTVTYMSSNESVATISGSTVTIVGVGNTDITASQEGNTNWNAATAVVQNLVVSLAPVNLATYDFTGGTANPTVVAGNVSISALTQGNNNGTTPLVSSTSASSGYIEASGGNNAGAAARTGTLVTGALGSAYFEFTITPASGYSIKLTGISFGTRSTTTGPQDYTLRSSNDLYSSDLANGSISNNSTWYLKSNTGITITSTASNTFRIYGFNGTGSAAVNTANWRIDDLILTGNVLNAPAVYAMTGGGAYCAGGLGTAVGLSDSELGVDYTLIKNGTPTATVIVGDGNAISFGLQAFGTYTASGTADASVPTIGGTAAMSGSAMITEDPLPDAAGSISGSATVTQGDVSQSYTIPAITNASNYVWAYSGDGATITGNGTTDITIDFSAIATSGTLSVYGHNDCGDGANATLAITVNPLAVEPIAQTVTGGGSYCASGAPTGIPVGLAGSEIGVTYTLTPGGATMAGTGSAISFGNQTAGTYTISGTNAGGTTGMTGSAIITIAIAPSGNPGSTGIGTSGAPYQFTGASALNGTVLWTHDGNGNLDDATKINPLYTSLPSPPVVTVNFTLTISHPTCPDAVYYKTLFLTPASITTTWTGDIDENWNSIFNWSDGIPGPSTNVIIPIVATNYPTITDLAVCNNITVNNGASLIDNGNLTLSSGAKIIVEHPSISAGRWHFISSPVSGAVSGMFTGDYLYEYATGGTYTPILSTSKSLDAMVGYALYPKTNAYTSAYVGGLNPIANSFTVSGAGSGDQAGWNLVGNPYTSAIDWAAASGWTKPAAVDNATYIVSTTTINWKTYVNGVGNNGGSRYIAPTQGFFVHATDAGTLAMTNDVQVHNPVSFSKKAEAAVSNLLRLEVSGNEFKDEAVVRFTNEATPEFDGNYDALKLYGYVTEAAQLYTLGSIPLAINSLPETGKVPVGIKVGTNGSYTIAATEISDMPYVTLEDNETGIYTNLSDESYTFEAVAGTFDQRFILHFSMLSVEETKKVSATVYSYQQTVHINMKEQVKGDIYIYNIAGQLVSTKRAAQGMNEIKLPNVGNYIVKVITKDNTVVRKVFIQ